MRRSRALYALTPFIALTIVGLFFSAIALCGGELIWPACVLVGAGMSAHRWFRGRGRGDGAVVLPIAIGGLLMGTGSTAPGCFENTKFSAYRVAMKSDLRNLVTAQETFFRDSARYAATTAHLQFTPSAGVAVPKIAAGDTWWSATNTHAELPGLRCGIAVATANPLVATAGEGEVVCDTVRR